MTSEFKFILEISKLICCLNSIVCIVSWLQVRDFIKVGLHEPQVLNVLSLKSLQGDPLRDPIDRTAWYPPKSDRSTNIMHPATRIIYQIVRRPSHVRRLSSRALSPFQEISLALPVVFLTKQKLELSFDKLTIPVRFISRLTRATTSCDADDRDGRAAKSSATLYIDTQVVGRSGGTPCSAEGVCLSQQLDPP